MVVSFLFGIMAQFVVGGFTHLGPERWLYYAVAGPFVVNFIVLLFYFKTREATNKKLWLFSIFSGLFVTWYSGTIGAIIGETIVRGEMESINMSGVFGWGTIYAFCFLPFTVPLARLLNGMVLTIFYKTKKVNM